MDNFISEDFQKFLNKLHEIESSLFRLTNPLQNALSEIVRRNSLSYEDLREESQGAISVSEQLGRHGWTINDFKTPNNPAEWLDLIESDGEEAIESFFTDGDIEAMFSALRNRYNNQPDTLYLSTGIENFNSGRNLEAIVFFIALLDYRISDIGSKYRKKGKQIEAGLSEKGRDSYQDFGKRPALRTFVTCFYIPSFTSFAKRLFVDDPYTFESGQEPPYLNRNWLMHGRMKRTVKRYECVQLINALYTLDGIEEMLVEELDDGQTQNAQP